MASIGIVATIKVEQMQDQLESLRHSAAEAERMGDAERAETCKESLGRAERRYLWFLFEMSCGNNYDLTGWDP